MGGQTCKTCQHQAKEAIDQALVSGESNRRIATQYGLSEASVRRHKGDHVPATLVAAAEAQENAHGGKLLDQVQGLVDEALQSIKRSKTAGKERDVLGGIREARHSLELTGRITGELRENSRDTSPDSPVAVILRIAAKFTLVQLEGQVELTSISHGEPAAEPIEGKSRLVDK